MKKILAVMLSVCMLFCLCACDFAKDIADLAANDTPKDKTFDLDGISIELNTNFLRMDFLDKEEYDFIVGDENISIFGVKAPFEDTGLENCTVLEYTDLFYQQMTSLDIDAEIIEDNGIKMVKYTDIDGDGEESNYVVAFYKAQDYFWVITFAVDAKDYEQLYPDICKYVKSVKCN